jgi:hypothetical protein
MNAVDSAEFKNAMLQEVNAHSDNDHWEVWEKASVPEGQDILPAVWAFKRKRRIDTREVYKFKARLNIHHGGMQKHGVNYCMGNVLPSSQLVFHQTLLYPGFAVQMENTSD